MFRAGTDKKANNTNFSWLSPLVCGSLATLFSLETLQLWIAKSVANKKVAKNDMMCCID
jgi:hypothetical protein